GVVGHDPEALRRVAVRGFDERPGDAEDQVVARLVREQQRAGGVEKHAGILGELDIHSSSSTITVPPATRSPSATCTAETTPSYGETRGVSIFIASSTASGCRDCTRSPSRTSTRRTGPGTGAGPRLCSAGPPPACAAAVSSGGEWGRGTGRLSRKPPRHGTGAGGRGGDSGGCSTRNAVVVSPARTAGWATSQRRN